MFSKKPDSTARPSGNSTMAGSTFSVLGPDIAINGDLTATADLHLDGRINGDIKCAALVQGEASEVTGMVVAESARVAGRIKGSITAGVLVIHEDGADRRRCHLWRTDDRRGRAGGRQVHPPCAKRSPS